MSKKARPTKRRWGRGWGEGVGAVSGEWGYTAGREGGWGDPLLQALAAVLALGASGSGETA